MSNLCPELFGVSLRLQNVFVSAVFVLCVSPALALCPASLSCSNRNFIMEPLGQLGDFRLECLHLHITCRLLWLDYVGVFTMVTIVFCINYCFRYSSHLCSDLYELTTFRVSQEAQQSTKRKKKYLPLF